MTKSIFTQWVQIQRKLAGISEHVLDSHSGSWSPNTDVYESADDVMVKVELAGVEKSSVHIHLEEQVLIIDGVRRDPYGGESTAGYRFRQMEIEYGAFRRVLALPFSVDGASARANMANGILKIRLPRTPTAAQTRISVAMES